MVGASLPPGAVVSDMARCAVAAPGRIHHWRKEFGAVADGFALVLIAPPEMSATAANAVPGAPTIEIERAGKYRSGFGAVGLHA